MATYDEAWCMVVGEAVSAQQVARELRRQGPVTLATVVRWVAAGIAEAHEQGADVDLRSHGDRMVDDLWAAVQAGER